MGYFLRRAIRHTRVVRPASNKSTTAPNGAVVVIPSQKDREYPYLIIGKRWIGISWEESKHFRDCGSIDVNGEVWHMFIE